MKGAHGVLSVAAAALACVTLAACGAVTVPPDKQASPKPSPEVRVNVGKMFDALTAKGFVCGVSGFYPTSPAVHVCAAVSGAFDQQVHVIGPASNGVTLGATLHDPEKETRASTDLVLSTFRPIMAGLFEGAAADRASRWLSEHADGGGDMSLGPYDVSLDLHGAGNILVLLIRRSPVPLTGPEAPLPTDATAVRQYAQAQGVSSCDSTGAYVVRCQKDVSGTHTEISATAPGSSESTPKPDAVGTIEVTVQGPVAPPGTYSAETAQVVKGLVGMELSGLGLDPASAVRVVDWISSQHDGASHGMVFDGMSVRLIYFSLSPPAIDGEKLTFEPAAVT